MADVIGTASILITAEGKDFPKSLEKLGGTLNKAATKAGTQAGDALSKGVSQATSKQVGKAAQQAGKAIQKGLVPAAEQAGQQATTALGRGLSKLVGIADKSAAATGASLKAKMEAGASAAATGISNTFDKIVPSGVQKAASKAGELLKSGLAKPAELAASAASSKVGGVLISGLNKAATGATQAFGRGFKIATSAVREAGAAVAQAGKKLMSGLGSAAKSAGAAAGRLMAGALKATAVGALAAVGAVAGKALVGGFGRLTSIDTATKKLEGLGIKGKQLTKTMDNALASVKGTAFGLDEAATAAGALVASGIQPGNNMEKALKGIANVAAVAGRSMADVSPIFTDAAAAGKITGDTLMRLEQSGIAASQMLSKEMGISVDELRKKVQKGEISFEEFTSAIEGPLGSAAATMGTSFKGMVANIGAAMNRMGATALKPVFEGLKTVMPSVIALFDRLGEAIKPIVEKLAPHVTKFFEWLKGILDGIEFGKVTEGAGGMVSVFLTMSEKVQEVVMKMLQGLPKLFGELIPKIAQFIIGKITFIVQAVSVIITSVANALVQGLPIIVQSFVNLLPMLVKTLLDMVPNLVAALEGLITSLSSLLVTMVPLLLHGALTLFMGLVTGLVQILPTLLQGIITLVGSLATSLVQALPLLLQGAIQLFLGLVQAVITILPTLLQTLAALLPVIVKAIANMVPQLLDAAVELFSMLIDAVIENLPLIIDALVTLLPLIIQTLLEMIPQVIDAAITLFQSLVEALPIILPMLVNAIVELLPTLVLTILNMIPTILDAAIRLFTALVEAFPIILPLLLTAAVDLIKGLFGKFKEMAPQMLEAGKNIISGLIKGIGSMGGALINSIKETVTDKLPSFVKKALGIASPSKVFKGFGHNIILGLTAGLSASAVRAETAIGRIVAKIKDAKGLTGKGAMVKYVEKQGKALLKAYDDQKAIIAKIKTEQAKLADMRGVRDDLAADIAGGLTGEFSLSDSIKEIAVKVDLSPAEAAVKDAIDKADALAAQATLDSTLKADKDAKEAANKAIADALKAKQEAEAAAVDLAAKTAALTNAVASGIPGAGAGFSSAIAAANAAAAQSANRALSTAKAAEDAIQKANDAAAATAALLAKNAQDAAKKAEGPQVGDEGTVTKKVVSFADIASNVKSLATKMKKFAGKLSELLKKGYPNAIVQQVAALGSEEGTLVADALLSATDTQRGDFLADSAVLEEASTSAGKTLANDLYNVGIQAQKGLVDGLIGDKAAIDKGAKDLADTLTKYVKKHLGIKSPSKVFEGLGKFMGEGLVKGLDKMAAPVGEAVKNMTGVKVNGLTATNVGGVRIPSTPPAVAPATAPVAAGGDTYQVSVTVTMDDISQLKDLEQFLKMVRVKSRMGVGVGARGAIG